jgi:serine/threonine protein kinase
MKRRTRRGGVIIGQGSFASVYTKPDPIEKQLPKGCEWKDGYVMKVFEPEVTFKARREWLITGKLRENKPAGMIYPESQCILKDGRYAIFSPKGGQSLFELFYTNDVIDTPEKLQDVVRGYLETPTVVRNQELIPKVVEALKVLKGQIETMNKSIIHTDIHEGNVVFDGEVARLIDFGECRANSVRCKLDEGEIDDIIEKLETKGGSRKLQPRVVKPKRRTRRRLSFRSK